MRSRLLLAFVVPMTLVLAACTSAPVTPSSTATPTESTTASPTAAPTPVPDAIAITVDGLTLLNDDGSTAGSTSFADGAGTLAFLYDRLAAEPTVERDANGYPFTFYDWGTVRVVVTDGAGASVRFGATEIEGLALRTAEGVTVGDTRAAVLGLGAEDGQYDGDGDGAPDFLRLSVREAPGTQSLQNPGEVGVDYISVDFQGDEVASIQPGNDYSDI